MDAAERELEASFQRSGTDLHTIKTRVESAYGVGNQRLKRTI
jgi:hypothetical protein